MHNAIFLLVESSENENSRALTTFRWSAIFNCAAAKMIVRVRRVGAGAKKIVVYDGDFAKFVNSGKYYNLV